MESQINSYCHLFHYCFLELKPCLPFEKQVCFLHDSDGLPGYIEKYENIQAIKPRILELNSEWKKGRFYQDGKNYLMLCLENRWSDIMQVGICDDLGWKVNNSNYTLEYLNKKLNNKNIDIVKQKVFNFYMPFTVECYEENIVSIETACNVVEKWLDTNQYIQYFLNESGEIKTRKYPFDKKTMEKIKKELLEDDPGLTPISFE